MKSCGRFIILLSLLTWSQIHLVSAQSMSVKATSTGRTTGHIATLFLTNTGTTMLEAQPQTVYIPSGGDYQSYVASIPATNVPVGGVTTIVMNGYCADVHTSPVPAGVDMPAFGTWLPVGRPQTMSSNAIKIAPSATLDPFGTNDIPALTSSEGYRAVPSSNEVGTILWPGTDMTTNGIINPVNYANDFAPVIVAINERIQQSADNVLNVMNTPFSSQPGKEREAVIQQTFWIIMAALTGDEYTKKHFTDKVYDRYKEKTGNTVSKLSDTDKKILADGIDQFWRVFNAVASQAKLLRANLPSQVISGEAASLSIQFPWTDISLIDTQMKPHYGKSVGGNGKFPWIPTIIGAAGVGTGIYFLTRDTDEGPVDDCTFSVQQQIQGSRCGMPDGAIILTPFPVGNYEFVWSTGSTGSQLTNVIAAMYTVTITRIGTTCSQTMQFNVTNTNTNIGATANVTNAGCGQQNGAASISVATPGPYSYTWSNGATGTVQANLAAGNYEVTVSAGGTCQEVVSFTITELGAAFTASASATPAHCGLEDGSVTVTADPPANYTYVWSNGNTGTQDLTLAAGTYTITVSLADGACSKVVTATVDELPTNFNLTISNTPAACGQNNGTATVNASPSGSYEYVWSNGATTLSASSLAPGDYTVTVSIAGTQCSKTISTTITELAPTFQLSAASTPSTCGQASGSGTVTVTPAGSYSFLWSNGATSSTASNLAPGSYTITVSITGTQCTKTVTTNVTELGPTFQLTTSSAPADCGQANGTATINVNPAASYTYLWSNGITTQQNNNLTSGIYQVTVTLAGTQCSKDTSVNVGQAQVNFTATLSSTPALCGLSNGSATINVQPPGEYTYSWSNGQTGTSVTGLPVGTINVTVTDDNSCSSAFNVTVDQLPQTFVTIDSTLSANCLGGGEIGFTIFTSGSGPLVVQVVSETDSMVFNLPPGSYLLSEVSDINIIPGSYAILVYDLSIGIVCFEEVLTNVENESPDISTTDDFYITGFGQALSQNVLTNDEGLQLTLTSVDNVVGGQVTFLQNGQFTFTPAQGFSGEASFDYTIEDACGSTATGHVTITVQEGVCNFTITPTISPAHCGVQDGSITVIVNPAANYSYQWNNGGSGPTITNLAAGNYTVTITNNDLQCALVFTIPVTQAPVDHISNLSIIQPSCEAPGEIQFNVFTSGANPLAMTVEHPNGNDVFLVVPGTIQLSDFVPIVPGEYRIEVFDSGAGPSCSEELVVQLMVGTSIYIVTVGIIPPTTPSATDGSIIVTASAPGVLPYMVFLDGAFYGSVNSHTFSVEGLGVGEYEIRVIDANGCISNFLFAEVPPPAIIFSLGSVVLYTPSLTTNPERSAVEGIGVHSFFKASVDMPQGKTWHELQVLYSPTSKSSFVIDYYRDLYRWRFEKVQFRTQAGLGIHHGETGQMYDAPSSPMHWNLKGSAQYSFGKYVDMRGAVTFAGWDHIASPILELGCSIKFPLLRAQNISLTNR